MPTKSHPVQSGGQPTTAINIKGTDYVTVAERVRLANAAEQGYQVLSSDILPLGDTGRWYCRVTIMVGDRQYVGNAEIKLNAPANTADHDAPIECGETSALGRALGFAGIGIIDSIASADEMQRLTPTAQPTAQPAPPAALAPPAAAPAPPAPEPEPDPAPATSEPAQALTLAKVYERAQALEVPRANWSQWRKQCQSDPIRINAAITAWVRAGKPSLSIAN
jgi:hypothetical protein